MHTENYLYLYSTKCRTKRRTRDHKAVAEWCETADSE